MEIKLIEAWKVVNGARYSAMTGTFGYKYAVEYPIHSFVVPNLYGTLGLMVFRKEKDAEKFSTRYYDKYMFPIKVLIPEDYSHPVEYIAFVTDIEAYYKSKDATLLTNAVPEGTFCTPWLFTCE